jgi:hypothetical protein
MLRATIMPFLRRITCDWFRPIGICKLRCASPCSEMPIVAALPATASGAVIAPRKSETCGAVIE